MHDFSRTLGQGETDTVAEDVEWCDHELGLILNRHNIDYYGLIKGSEYKHHRWHVKSRDQSRVYKEKNIEHVYI